MTERTEVRWNFTRYGSASIQSYPTPFEYNATLFNVGGGTYTDYKYTIPLDGTYMIGYSCFNGAQDDCQYQFYLERNSVISSIDLVRIIGTSTGRSLSKVMFYNFLQGDIIYPAKTGGGNIRYNNPSYNPTNPDVYNSWWGIRLDY